MQRLWDEEILIQHTKKTPAPHLRSISADLTSEDCQFYGHTWHAIGFSGEKQCMVCGIKGYCPGCTPVPSVDASPFYCTKHTLGHSQEVQA